MSASVAGSITDQMAAQWYYKAFGQELGPMPFQELVHLARCGELAPDDMVRAVYESEWRRADSVVGLFYMARRGAPGAGEEPESDVPQVVHTGLPATFATERVAEPAECESPRWLLRILERVRSGELNPGQARRVLGELIAVDHRLSEDAVAFLQEAAGDELPLGANRTGEGLPAAGFGAGHGGEFARAVEDALSEIDSRLEQDALQLKGGVLGRLGDGCRNAIPDRRLLQQVARLGCAIVAANLAVLWVEDWSAREALRFPGLLEQQGARMFPLIGGCQPVEYWLAVINLALVAGLAAYLGVRWIENHLD